MTKGKLSKLLLAILASASLTVGLISCGDEDKKDDPTPIANNPSNTPTPCTDLDLSKLVNKTWYRIPTNGLTHTEDSIVFNSADSSWSGYVPSMYYSNGVGEIRKFKKLASSCNIILRHYHLNMGDTIGTQETIKVGYVTDTELKIEFDSSPVFHFIYKTTP